MKKAEQILGFYGSDNSAAGDVVPVYVNIDKSAIDYHIKKSGSYTMNVNEHGVVINAFDKKGVFNGLISMVQAIDGANKTLNYMYVQDAPLYQYRGMQVDVARHFHSVTTIKRLLDTMALLKLNKLHLGLTNDEGWRLQIPGIEELTEVGGKRCFDLTETKCLLPQLGSGPYADNAGSGYYTVKQYIDLVRYANARNIQVIPEINGPGHARAAVISMEARYKKYAKMGEIDKANQYRLHDPEDNTDMFTIQYYKSYSFINPAMPSAESFLHKVIDEVVKMHQQAGQPLTDWHFGGDEAKNIMTGGGFATKGMEKEDNISGLVDAERRHPPLYKSPIAQKYMKEHGIKGIEELAATYLKHADQYLTHKGIPTLQVWQDGLKHLKSKDELTAKHVVVNLWETLYWGGLGVAEKLAKQGYDIVLSPPDFLYFDFPNEVHQDERGYYWGIRANTLKRVFSYTPTNLAQNAEVAVDRDNHSYKTTQTQRPVPIYGISGQLWSETVHTDHQFEYMVYPRIFALAERAWHKPSFSVPFQAGQVFEKGKTNNVNLSLINEEYAKFTSIMVHKHFNTLDNLGVRYRLPVPGAMIKDGMLQATSELGTDNIQYSFDGKIWLDYTKPVAVDSNTKVLLRTISPNNARHSRITAVE